MNCFCRSGIRHAGRAQLEKLKLLLVLGAVLILIHLGDIWFLWKRGEEICSMILKLLVANSLHCGEQCGDR